MSVSYLYISFFTLKSKKSSKCFIYQHQHHHYIIVYSVCKLLFYRCRSYRPCKGIPFTHYQALRNFYNVYNFMIRSNQNLFRVFPPVYPRHLNITAMLLDIPLGKGVSRTRFSSNVVLEFEPLLRPYLAIEYFGPEFAPLCSWIINS